MPSPRMPTPRVLLTCGAAALWLAGCLQILGEVTIEDPPPDAGAPPPPVCTAGALRCEGIAFQRCKANETGWDTQALCGSAQLCGSMGCLEPACLVNELRCGGTDLRQLQICNDELTGWTTVDTCESSAQCNASAGRCTELPCAVEEQQCSGSELQQCNAVAQWALRATCLTAAQCNATLTSCVATLDPPCAFDEQDCSFGYAQRCKPTRDGFVDIEACVNSANCIQGEGCIAPRCTPGSSRCNGAELEQCDVNRRWVAVDGCLGPAYCNATLKTCSDAPCTPGSRQCSGAEWQECIAQGGLHWSTQQTCAAASLCDPAAGCVAPSCDVGDYRCIGQNLERCSIKQDAWIPVQACSNAALCNAAAKRCDWARCVPGSFRCDVSGTLSRCSDDGVGYQTLQACGSASACDANAGTCTPAAVGVSCTLDELRCNGQWLERCRGNPGVWRAESRCESATLCDVTTGVCQAPACAPGEYRCTPENDPLTGSLQATALEVCSPGRERFVLAETCSAAQSCDARHGQCDDCVPFTQGCLGSTRGLCSNDGQEFEVEEVCGAGCTVLTGGSQVIAQCEGS
jgi:hypothetical protein